MSWRRLQFLLFYLNFQQLLHQTYIKSLIKAFPQSCGKYLSFATLGTPVAVLGAEPLVFPCKVFFAKPQPKNFWAWAEIKTGLCWGRIKAKLSEKFQTLWIFNMFTCSNSIPDFVLVTCIMGLNMNIWTCWRSKVFEIRHVGKVVQHCENIWNSSPYY